MFRVPLRPLLAPRQFLRSTSPRIWRPHLRGCSATTKKPQTPTSSFQQRVRKVKRDQIVAGVWGTVIFVGNVGGSILATLSGKGDPNDTSGDGLTLIACLLKATMYGLFYPLTLSYTIFSWTFAKELYGFKSANARKYALSRTFVPFFAR